MSITLGSDPELMVFDKSKGRIVSAPSVMGEGVDKNRPVKLSNGVEIYADNALVEARFAPVTTPGEAVLAIRSVITGMRAHFGERYELVAQAAARMHPDDLKSKELWEIGCAETWNAYGAEYGAINPKGTFKDEVRTGSFHIHLGYPGLTKKLKTYMVRLLDASLGCASVLFDRDPTSVERRKVYGRAGEFRPTPYGVEYRVLGPYALRDPRLVALVWDIVEWAAKSFSDRDVILSCSNNCLVVEAINHCRSDLALENLNAICFPEKLIDRCICSYGNININKSWK